jgi:hypothetical protein
MDNNKIENICASIRGYTDNLSGGSDEVIKNFY